jgi:2-polyprenyl-3-methyl-5-hydroxy-6-metoxy-1,4-benzoquinol methylase
MPSLSKRDCQPELMDDPALPEADHQAALLGLRRVNRLSRSVAIVWPAIRALAVGRSDDNPLKVMDIACGGGDVTRAVARQAMRKKVPIVIDGCDINPFAVTYSRQGNAGLENIPVRFFQRDVVRQELPQGYDVLMCSLFLHHLSEDNARRLLSKMAAAASRLVLIDDLRRTRFGYALAYVGCRLLTRSPIVHHDGPLSVRAAFTSAEIQKLALSAGLQRATITHHWPQRFLLSWRKPA